jgi:hypothetical protein
MRIYTKVVVPKLYNQKEHLTMRKWCRENFGPSDEWRNINRWTYKFQGKFIFVNEEDAMMFALRWS